MNIRGRLCNEISRRLDIEKTKISEYCKAVLILTYSVHDNINDKFQYKLVNIWQAVLLKINPNFQLNHPYTLQCLENLSQNRRLWTFSLVRKPPF
jgi:hypothetical protein